MPTPRSNLVRNALVSGFAAAALASRAAYAADLPIQDNSLLVEEAYNQEHGVVQTVLTYQRIALLVPTGNAERSLGSGGVGAQGNLLLSAVLSPSFVTHTNLGATRVFSAEGAGGKRLGLTSWNAGQSLVWLAHPAFNVLLEAVYLDNELPALFGEKD